MFAFLVTIDCPASCRPMPSHTISHRTHLNFLGNTVQIVVGNQLSVEQYERARMLHEGARLVLDVREVDLKRRLEVDEVDAA